MGKHLSPSNEVEEDSLEQHLLELVGVLVRSWSTNWPIPNPEDDPFWRGRKTCMSFARSLASPGLKCES